VLPLLPLVIVIQLALLVAVQLQPEADVVTETLAGPPAAPLVGFVGLTVKPQEPACVTVTVWPATVSVPVRPDVDVFAATV
jgi:hypothetical protein